MKLKKKNHTKFLDDLIN